MKNGIKTDTQAAQVSAVDARADVHNESLCVTDIFLNTFWLNAVVIRHIFFKTVLIDISFVKEKNLDY